MFILLIFQQRHPNGNRLKNKIKAVMIPDNFSQKAARKRPFKGYKDLISPKRVSRLINLSHNNYEQIK